MDFEDYNVPEEACEYRFVLAGGPGGQHVNKNATAVELRVHVQKLALPRGVATRLKQAQAGRINKEGQLLIQASEHRSQLKNKKAALFRLEEMLKAVWQPPKRRIATRPSAASQRRRVTTKKQRGEVKISRQKPRLD